MVTFEVIYSYIISARFGMVILIDTESNALFGGSLMILRGLDEGANANIEDRL